MITAPAPVLTPSDVTVTTDRMGRVYAVIPNTVARPLTVASCEGIDPDARGAFFESAALPADSWVTATVRTIFDAVLASQVAADDHHECGLSQYRKWDGGAFHGFIVGEGAWDADAQWWSGDHAHTRDLVARGTATIASQDRGHLAGTCTF